MYQKNVRIRFGGPLTPGVKKILIINASVFLIQQISGLISNKGLLEILFGLSHEGFVNGLMLWQPLTYMFLHGGWMHIMFNLLGLWMFAGEVELFLGEKRFIRFYVLSGLGAGLFIALMNYYVYLSYGLSAVTIGASGALYAVLIAYAILWPEREVFLYFLFPIKIKYLLLAYGVFEFFSTLSTAAGKAGNISHIGHLGGLVAGFFLMKFYMNSPAKEKPGISFIESLKKKYRLKKKRSEIEERIEAKKIIDDLLMKIAREGMSSLTADEKKKLEWARNHYSPGNDTVH
jgi:membrane associated rhomboid family serine protease